MTTLHLKKSKAKSPLRLGLLLAALALAFFTIPDRAYAVTAPPRVSTNPATFVASFSARLNSTVDPNGLATSVHFEYGTTTDYGLTTAPQTETGKAYRDIAANISGLAAHTGYHFRPVASNADGTIIGGDRAFTTLTSTGPPVVTIEPATNVTASGATLHGVVDPHGLTTRVVFRLENSNRYGPPDIDWERVSGYRCPLWPPSWAQTVHVPNRCVQQRWRDRE